MPNQPLMDQLDTLRDTYAQQQKAASTLQASLKVVADAHGKAQKALRDFSAQNTGIDVNSTQEVFAETRLREEAIDPLLPDLRRKLKELAALSTSLKDATSALRSEPVDVVRLDRAATALQAFRQEEAVAAILPTLAEELDLAQRGLADEFGQKLRSALADVGIQIGGRAPRFTIERFELEANFARRALSLRYGKDLVVPRAAITASTCAS